MQLNPEFFLYIKKSLNFKENYFLSYNTFFKNLKSRLKYFNQLINLPFFLFKEIELAITRLWFYI